MLPHASRLLPAYHLSGHFFLLIERASSCVYAWCVCCLTAHLSALRLQVEVQPLISGWHSCGNTLEGLSLCFTEGCWQAIWHSWQGQGCQHAQTDREMVTRGRRLLPESIGGCCPRALYCPAKPRCIHVWFTENRIKAGHVLACTVYIIMSSWLYLMAIAQFLAVSTSERVASWVIMTLDIFSPQMHVIIKCTRQKQHILPSNVKYCVYTCICKDVKMLRCKDVGRRTRDL